MINDKKKKVTINDIASASGVSISTVSHVLNGTAKISDETRKRVIDAVQKFSYVPNGYSLKWRGKNSKVVGVMVADIKNEFYASCVQSIMNAALQDNYTTMICEMAFNYKKECMGVDALLDNGVDGIIFIGGSMDGNIICKANKTVPVILCDRKMVGSSLPSVTTDNVCAMRNLISLLKEWGYTKIGLLTETPELDSVKDRCIGFKAGIEENGLKQYKEFMLFNSQLKLDKATGANCFLREYLERNGTGNLPEVFVTTSDLIAAGAISALRERGIRVPQDIGVTGFDNISLAANLDPPLTTISQNMKEMGIYCFRNILNLINGTAIGVPHSVIDAEIVIRKSVLDLRNIDNKEIQ
ncbi:MAG: LacI family DNA-binding transcriptional regulator [Christensenella sp.]